MRRLTEAQRQVLECCPDWSASWEIAARRTRRFGVEVYSRRTEVLLGRLQSAGLVEYGAPNQVWRITPAGRAKLKQEGR